MFLSLTFQGLRHLIAFQCLFGACKTNLSVRLTFLPVHLAATSMTCYPLLPALMTASLLQTSVVLAQDVLTIKTSLPYVFNGAWQYDLTCTVNPPKAMTFRWEGIDCNQREKVVGGDRCKFTPSQSNNGMTVMCIASYGTNGSSSEISSITTLNVLYPPSTPPYIASNIIGDTLYVGHSYRFTCTIVGGNPLPSIIFGCAPTSPFHHGVIDWGDEYSYTVYEINPAVLSDDGGVCKCTGYWPPQPVAYPLNASVTLRVVDLNRSAVLPINRTTLAERTSNLSASETLTFTTRTSSMTASETPIRDNEPDDNFKSNVFIGFGIMGVLLLACIIIGVFGLRMLSKREKKLKQNGAASSVEPDLIDTDQNESHYESLRSQTSPKTPVSDYLDEGMLLSETSDPSSILDSEITGDREKLVQNIYISNPTETVQVPASSDHPNPTSTA